MTRTPKGRALGAALRQARQDKGLLLRELATAISRDTGAISRWETGERTPKPELVAQILARLGVDGERYDEIMTLAYGTDGAQWMATTLPEQRQQMTAYIHWEQNASRIVEVAPSLVPGLLQTGDYIRAIMTAPGVPMDEVAARVTSRIGRREVVTKRHQPAELLVLLGQSALNQDIGGTAVMIDQLGYLVEMAARPNIELRLVPDHRGWHPGLEGAFALIESSDADPTGSTTGGGTMDSIVFVGTRRSALMLHEASDVNAYRRAVDDILRVSLSPDASVKFITDLRTRMEKHRGK